MSDDQSQILLSRANDSLKNEKYDLALGIYKDLYKQNSEVAFFEKMIRYCEFKLNPNVSLSSQKSPSIQMPILSLNNPVLNQHIDLSSLKNHQSINQFKKTERNGYEFIYPEKLETVTIVVPVFNRSKILGMTLAAITHQTYPVHLIEVIVVDDGSHEQTIETIRKFQDRLNIIYYWHQDKGYRPGQARNAGMKLAQGENIITLDCDMLPTKHLVAEYMFALAKNKDRIFVGPRKYVCTDHFTVDDLIDSSYWIDTLPEVSTKNSVATASYMGKKTVDWRHSFFARTDFLQNSIFPFISFASGNVAYPRSAFEITAGYDDEFEKWGSEDTEFGYRLFCNGYYIEPIMGALALHQEPPGGENEVDRSSGYVSTKQILKEKCPLFSRDFEVGKKYRVSKYCFINNTSVNDADFKKNIQGYEYADYEIDNSLFAKKLALMGSVEGDELQQFLQKNSSAFFVIFNQAVNDNVPQYFDEILKQVDQDLGQVITLVQDHFKDSLSIVWRGSLMRLLNF